MINGRPLLQFQPLTEGLVKPIYSDYAFGNIPNTIHFLLTGERLGALLPEDCFGGAYPEPEKIVLCFIDSFGWQFWQEYYEHFRTLRHVGQRGVLSPISALFPSTTAASVSTLNFGVLPSEHALYEWNIYVPAYGEVIQSLPFTPLGSRASDTCLAKGYDPALHLAVQETAHHRLAKHGVRSVQFAHRQYANSAYNKIVTAGAETVAHQTLAEALTQLKDALLHTSGKAFLSFYWASLDTIAHIYGPGTSYHEAEIISFWRTFDHVFRDIDAADTLYLFSADHGQVYADARQTVYINERIPGFSDLLAVSPTGNLIYPNGSPRDVFLHVKPDRYSEALDLLNRHLGDEALILPIETALDQGLFGPPPIHPEFRRRLGDILVLPYSGSFIWWRQRGLLQNRFNGHHGGLTPQEVITVLGAVTSL